MEGKVNFVMSECAVHGKECTIVGFATLDGCLSQGVHLNAAALKAVHTRLGQRVLSLDVPRAVEG